MSFPTAHVASRRAALLVLVLAALAAVGVFALAAPARVAPTVSSGLPASYQSAAAELRQAVLPDPGVAPAIVVYSRVDAQALSAADKEAVAATVEPLRRLAAGAQQLPPSQYSSDGTVALVAVPVDTTATDLAQSQVVGDIRATAANDLPQTLKAQVTGAPAFTTDLGKVFDGADVTLLLATVAVVALLLIVTYRSPWLWLVPLVVVAGAEQVTAKLVALLAPHVGVYVDDAASGITSVLVFGAATDYALLLIARYRDQLREQDSRFDAMGTALKRTAEPIIASAVTVTLSLLTLLLADQQSLRGLGFSAAVGIVMAMLAGLIVLPAAMVVFGRRLFWPFVPRVGDPVGEGRFWGRVGALVARRPHLVGVTTTAILVVLATGAIGLTVGLSENEQFQTKPEAVLGQETLAAAFPAGATALTVVLTNPASQDAVIARTEAVPGVASVRPGVSVGDVAQVDVVLADAVGTDASATTIRDLRAALSQVAGADAVVGGAAAERLDADDAAARDARVIIPLVLLIVGGVLVVLLRALVAPVLLVATVLGTYFAAVGASWWIFANVLGYPALDSGVLLLSFLFLVALGVDYNIFLVTRAREDTRRLGTRAGMLAALRATGGVITSAGILLAAVFAVLGVLPLIALAQIGLIVCLGVLLDSLLVRTVLVPALAFVFGERFWWPAQPSRTEEDEDPLGREPWATVADPGVRAVASRPAEHPGRTAGR
ncbi:MAG: MMPL family transporter [Actinomycetes bacterium]